jgi:glutamine cyclotransferase
MIRRWRARLFLLLAACMVGLLGSCMSLPEANPSPVPPTANPSPIPPTATSRIPTSPPDLATAEPAPVYGYRIIHAYPHDPDAFTQGLVVEDGVFYEGTGLWGRSTLRRVDLETGAVLQNYELPAEYFGEGITVLGNKIFQLTWQSHIGFVYDKKTFEQLEQFFYPTQGWGLTHDGERLIMSDGTPLLHFLDPSSLEEIGQVVVRDRGGPVFDLNELEYIHGEVWANVWQTDRIARIDPDSGQVLGWIDLSGLLSPEDLTQPVDVLNGIAYDPETDRLFVTGKLWPRLFEIELVPPGEG